MPDSTETLLVLAHVSICVSVLLHLFVFFFFFGFLGGGFCSFPLRSVPNFMEINQNLRPITGTVPSGSSKSLGQC